MDDAAQDPFVALAEAAEKLRPLTQAVEAQVGLRLPAALQDRFRVMGSQMSLNNPGGALVRLTVAGGADRDWLIPFRSALLDHVQEGLGASIYHLENIRELEERIIDACLRNLPEGDPPTSQPVTTGVASTAKLDYEYQAFRFALRRTLDYLAVAIAAAFQRRRTKFSQLQQTIRHREPDDARERVLSEIAATNERLADILTGETSRDRIAHWEAMPAGVLNVAWHPGRIDIGFAGGGEKLVPWTFDLSPTMPDEIALVHTRLAPLISNQYERTVESIFAMVEALGITTI